MVFVVYKDARLFPFQAAFRSYNSHYSRQVILSESEPFFLDTSVVEFLC